MTRLVKRIHGLEGTGIKCSIFVTVHIHFEQWTCYVGTVGGAVWHKWVMKSYSVL